MINVGWQDFRNFIGDGKHFKCLDINDQYHLFAYDGPFCVTCQVDKTTPENADQTDFLSNFYAEANGVFSKKNANHVPIVDNSNNVGLLGSNSMTVNTHDFTDRTTWYQRSVQVQNETLIDSGDGKTFTSANPHWINIDSPLLTYDYRLIPERDGSYTDRGNRRPVLLVDSVQINDTTLVATPGYTINHAAGTITFADSQAGKTVQATYWHNNEVDRRSEWILNPPAGCAYILSYIEFQFSKTVTFSTPIHVEIWAGADPATYADFSNALYDAGYGQNKSIYRGPQDFLNICTNRSSQSIAAFGGLTSDVYIFPFDYLIQCQIRSSQGVVAMFALEGDIPYATAEIATGTFYTQLVPESSL